MWRGQCHDESCRAPLIFSSYQESVSCYTCGQEQKTKDLFLPVPYDEDKHGHVPTNINLPPRPPDLVKVGGMTNYHQKLISPLLTTHGMDKHTGKAKSLRLLTGRGTLDCSVFGDRSFRLDSKYKSVRGFGSDEDAHAYLSDTLHLIKPYNDDKLGLVALHTDGDGHCLVHAVSRALVGTQLFWHPLRIGLKHHFNLNIDKYKSLLGNFIDRNEWQTIIEECSPDYRPTDGSMVGLRNVHIFGLANLLRRPIILLDCMAGINASADYAGVFLPGLNPPMACSIKAGLLNPPICLAWSSAARNHYVPLVPLKEIPLPRYPRHLLPKVWGFPQNVLDSYIKFDEENCLTIGSENVLSEAYMNRLARAMDEQFLVLNGVHPSIVSDLYYYHYSRKLVAEPKAEAMVEVSTKMVTEKRLLRCLTCRALCFVPLNSQWLRPGGHLYLTAKKLFGFLRENHQYTFASYGIVCTYNSLQDMLEVHSPNPNMRCTFCQSSTLRTIQSDGSIKYRNGDTTLTVVTDTEKSRCKCGFKHFWDGVEYDNPPIEIPIEMEIGGKRFSDKIYWFQNESVESLNSKNCDIATQLLQKHDIKNEKSLGFIVEQLKEITKSYSSCDAGLSEDGGSASDADRVSRKRPLTQDTTSFDCSSSQAKRSPSVELDLTPATNPDSPGPSTSKYILQS